MHREEPGWLQSMGSQSQTHDRVTKHFYVFYSQSNSKIHAPKRKLKKLPGEVVKGSISFKIFGDKVVNHLYFLSDSN